MTRFSLRASGDVQAYTSAISAAGFATAAGESRWSEARTVGARVVDSSNAASAAVSAGFSALEGSVSRVATFILNTSNRWRYKPYAATGLHHARRASALVRRYMEASLARRVTSCVSLGVELEESVLRPQ